MKVNESGNEGFFRCFDGKKKKKINQGDTFLIQHMYV